MSNHETQYFDLLTSGLGYLNRVREVTPEAGNPFLSVTLAALRGSADNAQYTPFECRVAGHQAKAVVQPKILSSPCTALTVSILNPIISP